MLVSVVMPVYNAELYLSEAINSILNQTHANLELILINDGSMDGSEAIIQEKADHRIKYIKFDVNQGIVAALNAGIDASTGKYVFRMDADDISFHDRLARQISIMESNPDVDILGSKAIFFDESIEFLAGNDNLPSPVIELLLLFCSPFIHPSIVFRKASLDKYHFRYHTEFKYGDDYELFTRVSGKLVFKHSDDVVLRYRVHQSADRLSGENKLDAYLQSTLKARMAYFEKLQLNMPKDLIAHYENLFYSRAEQGLTGMNKTISFYSRTKGFISGSDLKKDEMQFLLNAHAKWYSNHIHQYANNGWKGLLAFYRNRKLGGFSLVDQTKFGIKSLLSIVK